MIVIDSSVLVKFFSREEGWKQARRFIEEGAITVDMAVKEVANALWKKVLQGDMELSTALEIVSDLSRGDVVRLVDQKELLGEALKLAAKTRITVYDALFIVLAKRMGLKLVTADRRQAKAAEEAAVEVILLS